jgi:uncharacterized protein YcsI (UPF0317 family)
VPRANAWHTLAVTFDGVTEKVYVNGVFNGQESKTLHMYQGDPVFIGCSFDFRRAVAAEEFPVVVERSETVQPPWSEIAVPVAAVTGPPVTVVDNGASPDDIAGVVSGPPAAKQFARVRITIPFSP